MRCKFSVNSIERTMGSMPDPSGAKTPNGYPQYIPTEMWTVKMSPVYGNGDPNHENTRFWLASPSGSFTLSTVNKGAVESLQLGEEVYIDIVHKVSHG